jgi:hypothetical protein
MSDGTVPVPQGATISDTIPVPSGATFVPVNQGSGTVPVPAGATFSPVQPLASTLPPFDPRVAGRYTTEENYPKWAATQPKIGPDTKPGEYEAWSGVQEGTNKQQAIASLKQVGTAALETGLAILPGAGEVPAAGELIDAGGNQIGKTVVQKVVAHLTDLDSIVKAAKALGWAGFGLKEARDLYKEFTAPSK